MAGNLKQVARAARVSLATASRVLSGSTYPVSPELRERVLAVAAELDYVPNAQARALISGNARTVGMLVGEVGDPYFDAMIDGVHRVAAEEGCLVTIIGTYRDTEKELASFRQLQSHGASIIIVAGSGIEENEYRTGLETRIESFAGMGRVVVMGRHHLNPTLNVIRVEADNRGAGRLLGEHLRALGHTHVGVLSGRANVTSTIDRITGLTEGLGRRPLVEEVPQTRDGGYAGAAALVRQDPDLTAIVGTADQMAVGALAYCKDHGISVPQDMSVAGCNDIWVSRDLTPSLTTVHFPLAEMGAAGLRLALATPVGGAGSQTFKVHLVARGSTGPSPDEQSGD
ncbi:LacI family transcriptional regulator [Propioniciclava sinopodophylli]|uniref:LacI family transcriptional regulator n=1 Tax=Propioniciclava sinopodophylli TaxID=1837344 RepID=A0A4V2JS84_9ACTN|nr:LacI family DNA-binding transcriptional regulator [Propioniciclava sinopodophylli]TBT83021.1 LacI family transcriptional regulator [Propioniciclava sinopodophylli]